MIYFIQAGENGPIKIGQTSNGIKERLAQLQTGNHEELKVLWVYYGDVWGEFEIHSNLANSRLRGEWFSPSEELFNFISSELYNQHEVFLRNFGLTVCISESEGDVTICPDGNDTPVVDFKICKDKSVIVFTKKGFKDFRISPEGTIDIVNGGSVDINYTPDLNIKWIDINEP